MRLLPLVPCLVLVGCVPAGTDDDAPPDIDPPDDATTLSNPQDLTINWHFKGLDGNPIPCPAGFTVMEVWITNNNYDEGYWQHIEKLPCSASDGTFSKSVFTSGEEQAEDGGVWTHGKIHDVRLVVTEPTGQSIAAGAPQRVEGSPPDPGRFVTLDRARTLDFDIYPDGGWGVAKWHLVSNNTKADLESCATAGVDTIRFTYFKDFYPGTTTPIVTEWPCSATDIDFAPDAEEYELGSGRTRAMPPGTYYGTLEALRNGVVVGTRGGDGDAIGFDSNPGNDAFPITNVEITITDR
jgi:hypothetical protein